MKTFYIIFQSKTDFNINGFGTQKFYRIESRARSFGECERKFKKQTLNKFKDSSHRTIHEIKLKS